MSGKQHASGESAPTPIEMGVLVSTHAKGAELPTIAVGSGLDGFHPAGIRGLVTGGTSYTYTVVRISDPLWIDTLAHKPREDESGRLAPQRSSRDDGMICM